MPDQIPITPMQSPSSGLDTINTILGLKQRQQSLQTGAYHQDVAKNEAQTSDMVMGERQKVAAYLSNPANKGKKTEDMADDIHAIAPTTGEDYLSKLRDAEVTHTGLESARNKLSADRQARIGQLVGSFAGSPLSNADIGSKLDEMVSQDPKLVETVYYAKRSLAHVPDPTSAQDPQAAAQAASVRDKLFAQAEYGFTNGSPLAGGVRDQGTTATPVATSAVTGAQTPTGPAYDKTQIGTAGTGQAAVIGPKGVNVIGGPANTTTAQQIGAQGQAKGVTERVQQATAQANNTVQAQDALSRAKAILESPESPSTGGGFSKIKDLKNLMSGLGIDTQGADDMNTLAKNLARFEASRATAAGLGGTDAARELAHNGSPNTALDNKALLGIVRQSLAAEKALSMYAGVQGKSNDPEKQAKNEADFRNIPHLIEAHEFGLLRNKDEADEFLKKHGLTAADMKKARDAVKEFGSR